jgi:hypothetical protein
MEEPESELNEVRVPGNEVLRLSWRELPQMAYMITITARLYAQHILCNFKCSVHAGTLR